MEKAFVVRGAAVKAYEKSALSIQPAEGSFNHPTMAPQTILRFDPAASYARLDSPAATCAPAFPMIVCFVRVGFLRPLTGTTSAASLERWNGVEQFFGQLAIIHVCSTQSERERDAPGVDHKMAFATRLAFNRWIRAGDVAPLFAATLELKRELSMATRLQSISSAHANS